MQKNGFNRYFTWDNLDDIYHNTLPIMNSVYKNSIIDNFLEMFNNVIDHANSSYVYVCGQFFRKV